MPNEDRTMAEQNDFIAQALYEHGWVVVDDYIPEALRIALLEEKADLLTHGEFRQAGVGKGDSFAIRPEIRSDSVSWMDESNLSPQQEVYWQLMGKLRQTINQRCFLGLRSFECHFAVYPRGSFYLRHLDQFQAVKYRVVTVILYLNDDWKEEDGGALRIYLPAMEGDESHTDILPKGGRLVVFLSGEIPHEVLPTQRERASITGWFRDVP